MSQEQQRALAGHTQPSLVPCYVLPVDPRTGCLEGAKSPEKGPGSEGRVGHPEGSRLRGEVLAMPVLEPLPTLGEAGPPVSADHVCCCCQSLAKVWPAQAILAGTVCLANLMSPELNAWRILT